MSKKKTTATAPATKGKNAPRSTTKPRKNAPADTSMLEPVPVETAAADAPVETTATEATVPDAAEPATTQPAGAEPTETTEGDAAEPTPAETTPAETTAREAAEPATAPTVVADAPAKKMSALDAAAKVLGETGRPMSCPELIEAMAVQGLWTSPGGKTPAATLYAAMTKEIVTKRTAARFQKTGRDQFAANAERSAS